MRSLMQKHRTKKHTEQPVFILCMSFMVLLRYMSTQRWVHVVMLKHLMPAVMPVYQYMKSI